MSLEVRGDASNSIIYKWAGIATKHRLVANQALASFLWLCVNLLLLF
jgi:hypothetical protein